MAVAVPVLVVARSARATVTGLWETVAEPLLLVV